MPLVSASIDVFLVTTLATVLPWIYFTIWRTTPRPTNTNLNANPAQPQQQTQNQLTRNTTITRTCIALFIALHSIYILYNVIVRSQQNLFTVLKIPLTEPTDAIRARLLHIADVPDLPEALERLLMRFSSFDTRHRYVR